MRPAQLEVLLLVLTGGCASARPPHAQERSNTAAPASDGATRRDAPASSDALARTGSPRRGPDWLQGGLDVPEEPGARVVEPTTFCIQERPAGVRILVLERDCTCGEPLSCTLAVRGDVIEVRFRENPGPGICDDCYASRTSCTLPNLSPERRVSVRVDGRVLHEATTDAAGRLPASPCRQLAP